MALVQCHECGKDVSTEARNCPSCGAKVKKPSTPMRPLTKRLLMVFGIGFLILVSLEQQRKAADAAATTPEQRAQEEKRTAQLQIAGAGALTLKRAMKDPESFKLTSLIVKTNGAACYKYRAKNSFGADLPSEAVLTKSGKMFTSERDDNAFVKAWNKECASAGGDEIVGLLDSMGVLKSK